MALPEEQARTELGGFFHGAVTEHADVMAECLSILRLYNLPPPTLFYKYEAFLLSRPSGLRAKLSILTLDTIRELRKEIQREQQINALNGINGTPGGPGSADETTPKGGMGVRKGKGNMTDLGGFLDGLTTPSRPSKSRSTNPVPSRLSNTSNNANVPSVLPSAFTPTSGASYSTPQRPSSALSASANASSSSYRPSVSKVPPTINGNHLGTSINTGTTAHSAPSSPVSGGESPAVLTAQTILPFDLRPQPHSLVETLNPHLPSSSDLGGTGVPAGSKSRVALTSVADLKHWDYRYMFEKISQRSEALDDLIDDFAESIREAYGIHELGDPHFVSDDPIHTVGRILSMPTDGGKVTSTSLYLESSRLLGGGKRVSLRFPSSSTLRVRGGAPGVKGFGVFPGCLVCVKGRNGGGGAFVVDEVLMPPPSALPQTPISDLLEYHHGDKLSGQSISMMVASGPFTLDDDISYAPLEALVDIVRVERPDVLLMLGPFVDSQHPSLINGQVRQTSTEIWREQIGSRLQRIIDHSPGTHIILVPSVRDAVSRHVAYPQAMLDKELLGIPKRIKALPNPSTFSLNEVVVAVSSVDVLFHLRCEELVQRAEESEPDQELKNQEVKDSMAGLVRHVLGQRSFYPIFPPPEPHASEVNLDVTHYPLLKMDGPAPDVLILPSKLKHFSKIVDSTLVVNPAYLSRAHSAGTFAKILIHPISREDLETKMEVDGVLQDAREHGIWERARSEIWRI